MIDTSAKDMYGDYVKDLPYRNAKWCIVIVDEYTSIYDSIKENLQIPKKTIQ